LKLRLQAALAVAVAVSPLAAGVAWNWLAGNPRPLSGPAALGLALLGTALVAGLWSRDLRRLLANDAPMLPAHAELAARMGRTEAQADMAQRLADSRAGTAVQMLEALPEPVLALDASRGLLRANVAARGLFGSAAELPALLRNPALLERLDRAEAERAPQQVELALSVPIERLLSAWIVPVDLEERTARIRTLVVLRDRTREATLERMRADFVANASHELRTPLSSLIGFIETLRGPAEGDVSAQRRFLAIMHEQAERMRRLLDDLLSLSQIEMAEHAPPTRSIDAGRVVRRVADEFEPRVAARNQRLEVTIGEALPPVTGDEDQLAQVVMNLLDNAVKYGREAGVIRVSAQRVLPVTGTGKGARRPGIAIVVEDDGVGILPEHLPRLTERFYRVDAGRSRAVGGTGLGLAIVKHIVNRHRGRLDIESQPGKGSVFTVWLPEGSGQ
jgi:two-component system phosphate regulon sensor histidine kinase PhoR